MRKAPKPYDPDNEADILRALSDTPKSYPFDSAEFRGWAQNVEEDAKIICKDLKGERIRFAITKESGGLTIDMGRVNSSTLVCIMKAIRQNHTRMPDNLGKWYLLFLRYLEIQKGKLQTRKERE